MLYYCSLHPEWDCFGDFGETARARTIDALFGAIASNQPRASDFCFSRLERLGVFLGSGAFASILLQKDPACAADPEDPAWPFQIVEAAGLCFRPPLWYCFSTGGQVYLLCCFPRLQEDDPGAAREAESLLSEADSLQKRLAPANPALRIIVSDLQFGEAGIFRSFNNLHHAMEYFDFRGETRSPLQLNSEEQLHGAFIGDLSAYRQFSVSMGEQLSRSDADPSALADQICDTILGNCVPSMESIHHHTQIFMLTFTDYLGGAGLVDAAYIRSRQIVYRAMEFERETEFRLNMRALILELHRQNQTLRRIGRQKRIRTIREYVEEHISDPELSVARISERFRIGAPQAARQFRYYYGVSLYRFLQQTRYQYTLQLLGAHPDWSTRQVARAAGYSDLSTMYRAFHTFGDVTPGALRNALRQDPGERP